MTILNLTCKRIFRLVNTNLTYVRLSSSGRTSFFKNKNILVIGLIPVIPTINAQNINLKDEKSTNSIVSNSKSENDKEEVKSYAVDDEKTPWERVEAIFEKDEFGNYSKELITTLHACYMAMAVGFIYGGVMKSRVAFVDFMERNQASIFENHLDAKRRLQNHVTIHFGKGAFQWAWRLATFTGGYMLLFFSLHAYRGTTRISDYAVSGAIIGALIRLKFGPRAIVVGGVLGGIMGLFSGLANHSMLSLFGVSYDDILELQYKVDHDRTKLLGKKMAQEFERSGHVPKYAFDMLKDHENKKDDV